MSIPSRMVRALASRGGSLLARSTSAVVAPKGVASSLSSKTTTTTTTSRLSLSTTSGGSLLTQLAKENPYKDVVRYEHKNRKWSLSHVDFYSEALAIGLLENGLQPGDVVLSWLPPHFSESVSCLLVCLVCACTRKEYQEVGYV